MKAQMEISRRIKTRLAEIGAKQRQLAEAIGTDDSTLSELLNAKKNRRWSVTQLTAVADFLKVPPSFLLDENQSPVLPQVVSTKPIMVIGTVQAGVFKDALEWPEDDQFPVAVPISQRLAPHCFALVLEGTSLNKIYPEGAVAVFCPLEHYPDKLRSGDRVLVRRDRGGAVEATVKELEIKDGKALLWPRSHDPKYQSPISICWPYETPQQAGIDTVSIAGVVQSVVIIEKKI